MYGTIGREMGKPEILYLGRLSGSEGGDGGMTSYAESKLQSSLEFLNE